jgi:hypothetical protein
MDKIKIDAGGYELNGKYITPADIDKLSAEEIEALANTTASGDVGRDFGGRLLWW